MKILIMGGTQFVGKSLAIFLISKGHQVSIFTRNKLPIDYRGIKSHFIGDRKIQSDLNQIKNILFDIVFDISAYELQDVTNLISYLYTPNLKKYIFMSSGTVYEPSEEEMAESFPCGHNINWGNYGLNKLKIEQYLYEQYSKNQLPISIVRPTYIYGIRNNLYRETYFFDSIRKNKIIPIPSGKVKTQYIYIDDLLNFFQSLMESDFVVGETFNITNPQKKSWRELVEAAANVMSQSVEMIEVNCSEELKSRDFFPFRNCTYLLSIEKLKDFGLYIPKISIDDGLKLTYQWYLKENIQLFDTKMNKIEYSITERAGK